MSLLSFLASIRKDMTASDVHVSNAGGGKPRKPKKPSDPLAATDNDEDDNTSLPVTNMTLAAQQLTGQARRTSKYADVLKVDETLGLVLGWAIVCKKDGCDYYDLQEDNIPEASMLSAAVDFMQNSRMAKEMHSGESCGSVVFAFPLTEDIAKAFGIETNTTGLMIAMKPDSDEMLAKFRDGTLTGFSIGGIRLEDEEVA